MIYIIGIIGFIGGFALGLMILSHLLRERSSDDILNNSKLKWTYGTLNWLIAILGSYSAIEMYKYLFL